MEFYGWSDAYSSGNITIDNQHKKFFDIINYALSLNKENPDIDKMKLAIEELTDYTNVHLDDEIKFYNENKLPQKLIDTHVQLHENLKAELKKLTLMDWASYLIFYKSLVFLLTHWLIHHIINEDIELIKRIKYKEY